MPNLADIISERIEYKRREKGFFIIEMAKYLKEIWGVGMSNAVDYVRDLENNFFTRIENIKPAYLQIHQKRVSDYLASLGFSRKEAESIFYDIKKIRSDFSYMPSNVKYYKK